MKLTCDRCARVYSVSEDLAGRSFRMKCKACGQVITVKRGALDGESFPDGDEPLQAMLATTATGTYAISVPSPTRDENPFETQPISIAAVRAALDEQQRKKAQPVGQAPSTDLAGPPAEGYVDLILDGETPEPGAAGACAASSGAATATSAGARLAMVPAAQPAEDPFAGWDTDDEPSPPPPVPEPVPSSEARPATSAPVGNRAPPARTRATTPRGSRLLLVLAVAGAASVAAVLFLLPGSPSKPVADAARSLPAPAEPARGHPPAAEAPPAGGAAPAIGVPPAEEPAVALEPRADGARETRRADERRSRARRGPTARAEARPEPSRRRAAPPPMTRPSHEEVLKVVSANDRAFRSCIAEARKRDQGLQLTGRSVNLRMTVQPSGSVHYPTLDDVEVTRTDLGACLKSAARMMVFPRFQGDPFTVEVPLQLGGQ